MKYFWYGPLAQLVEQLTLNQRVAGSSPSRPIGCQTHGTGKCWCESISKTFMLFHFLFIIITLRIKDFFDKKISYSKRSV